MHLALIDAFYYGSFYYGAIFIFIMIGVLAICMEKGVGR